MFKPNLIIQEIWQTVNANATLQGADYLTTTGRVWNGRKPEQTDNPIVVISGSRVVSETQSERYNLMFTAYADNFENGTPDIARLGNIIGEVSNTLHNNSAITITGGRISSIFTTENTGVLFDGEHEEEHYQSLLLTLFAVDFTT